MSPLNDWIENSDDLKEYQDRYTWLYGVVITTFLILFVRLWFLQLVKGAEFKRFSEQNQIKEEKVQAPRGMILDRNGEILVDSLPAFNALLTPQYIVNLDKVASELAVALDSKKEDIIEKVRFSRRQNGMFKPVRIKENISRDEVAKLERMKIDTPGLSVEMGIKRNYLLGENGAQVFGYTAEISREELPILNAGRNGDNKLRPGDIIGKAGLEKKWDGDIRGVDGARSMVVDARGREIAGGRDQILGSYPEMTDSLPGHNLVLTVDKDLQKVAYDSFVANKRIGSIVALNPQTGEILAMLNAPSFDPNHFSTGIPPEIWAELINDPFKPLRDKVIQDHFPPGSTFKAVVALAALQEKIITPQTTFFCPGSLKYGKRLWHCWTYPRGHGYVNVFTALERSCDVFFYHMGMQLGIDRIAKYARLLGLGARTGIGLEGEKSGLIPDMSWKKKMMGEEWQPGENLPVAIGQGFILVTPLQLASTYASIATDGEVYKPFIIKRIEDIDGTVKQQFEPTLMRNAQEPSPDGTFITKDNFEAVKKGLGQVFEGQHGTGHAFRIPGLEMGGKTGTVQLFQVSAEKVTYKCENRDLKQRHNGWMVAFAPRDNPRIAVAVHAEHACHGTAAGPIIRDIISAYFKKYAPELLGNDKAQPTVRPTVLAPAQDDE